MMNDETGMIEKKADTIMKTSEALDGPGRAQEETKKTPREVNTPEQPASPGSAEDENHCRSS